MATTPEYMDFVCDRLQGFGPLRTRKMFGDYVVYLADKPILLVCDNAIFVKKRPELAAFLAGSPCGVPYEGAKEHYILDVEDEALVERVIPLLEQLTPLPQKRKKAGAPVAKA